MAKEFCGKSELVNLGYAGLHNSAKQRGAVPKNKGLNGHASKNVSDPKRLQGSKLQAYS